MTIQEVIDTVNALYPNTYEDVNKIKWISTIDKQTCNELYSQFVDGDLYRDFNGYCQDTPLDTELLIEDPYGDTVYRYYVQAQIALNNREMTDYSDFMTLFNNAYQTYRLWYNKTHEHIQPEVTWG